MANSINLKILVLKVFVLACSIGITTLGAIFIFEHSGDYEAYRDSFAGLGGERFEIGYRVLSVIFAKLFGGDHLGLTIYLVSLSIFSLYIKLSIIAEENRQFPLILVFIAIYTAYFFLLHESNQVRVSVGIAFGLWASQKASQNKDKRALLLLALGTCFHYSIALFALPLFFKYFLIRRKISFALITSGIIILVISITFNPLALGNLNPLMTRYADFNLDYQFNTVYLALLFSIILMGYLNISKMSQFSLILYLSYIFMFLLALSLMKTPIVAVRVMDIANVMAFFSVFSTRFTWSLSSFFLYLLPIGIAIPRCYVFLTTDTILKFPG